MADALSNCNTALHLSVVLGLDNMTELLLSKGADVNLRSRAKGFTALHLAVMCGRFDTLRKLLVREETRWDVEDWEGRNVLDTVHLYFSEEEEWVREILETKPLPVAQPVIVQEQEQDRSIKQGSTTQFKEQQDSEQIDITKLQNKDVEVIEGMQQDERIETVFGSKVALCLISRNWQHRAHALQFMVKQTEKFLALSDKQMKSMVFTTVSLVDAGLYACSITLGDKVVKV